MNGSGPHMKMCRSNRSGTNIFSMCASTRPVSPVQESAPVQRLVHVMPTRTPLWREEIQFNSLRKMMSRGVLADTNR